MTDELHPDPASPDYEEHLLACRRCRMILVSKYGALITSAYAEFAESGDLRRLKDDVLAAFRHPDEIFERCKACNAELTFPAQPICGECHRRGVRDVIVDAHVPATLPLLDEERWRALSDGERVRLMALCCKECGAIEGKAHSTTCGSCTIGTTTQPMDLSEPDGHCYTTTFWRTQVGHEINVPAGDGLVVQIRRSSGAAVMSIPLGVPRDHARHVIRLDIGAHTAPHNFECVCPECCKPDLAPDPDKQLACYCGWRGKRRDLTLHPRQGFGVCPRCWSRGVERIPGAAP